jgi:hypothetical protein
VHAVRALRAALPRAVHLDMGSFLNCAAIQEAALPTCPFLPTLGRQRGNFSDGSPINLLFLDVRLMIIRNVASRRIPDADWLALRGVQSLGFCEADCVFPSMFHVFADLVQHGLRGVGLEQCRLLEPGENDDAVDIMCPENCERLAAALAGVEVFIGTESDLRLTDACLLSLHGIRVLCAPLCPGISDKGIAALAGVEMLEVPGAGYFANVTDTGLAALAGIEFLALHGDMPRVTPAALAPLFAGGLRTLCMRPSLIDAATRAAMRAACCELVIQCNQWADEEDEEDCSTDCVRTHWEMTLPADVRGRFNSTWQNLFPGLLIFT